jgi:hypothetical protein
MIIEIDDQDVIGQIEPRIHTVWGNVLVFHARLSGKVASLAEGSVFKYQDAFYEVRTTDDIPASERYVNLTCQLIKPSENDLINS